MVCFLLLPLFFSPLNGTWNIAYCSKLCCYILLFTAYISILIFAFHIAVVRKSPGQWVLLCCISILSQYLIWWNLEFLKWVVISFFKLISKQYLVCTELIDSARFLFWNVDSLWSVGGTVLLIKAGFVVYINILLWTSMFYNQINLRWSYLRFIML